MSTAHTESTTNIGAEIWDPSAEDPMYPSRDGKPMADHTEQFDWIVAVKLGIEHYLIDDPNVFVAGNLLWYPVQGDPKIRVAPDTMIAYGRPKGPRSCYKQWQEGGIAPQVVFEVLSPGNRAGEMRRKLAFYELHGAEEYYYYDPFRGKLRGWLREGDRLVEITNMIGWVSPRLGITFGLEGKKLLLLDPTGRRLRAPQEAYEALDEETTRADEAQAKAKSERVRANAEHARAEAALALAGAEQARAREAQAKILAEQARADEQRDRATRLAEKLRALGIDPDDP